MKFPSSIEVLNLVSEENNLKGPHLRHQIGKIAEDKKNIMKTGTTTRACHQLTAWVYGAIKL